MILKITTISKLIASVMLLLVMANPIAAAAWQYGVAISPTTTQYDGIEMPTSSTSYSTAPSGTAPSLWVGAYNSAEGFAQNGILPYNGLSSAVSFIGSTTIPSGGWGLWYEYCATCQNSASGTYYGDGITSLSGWSSSDNIYYSVATYPSDGEYSFLWTDSSNSKSVGVTVCSISTISGTFAGSVWGSWESGQSQTTGWGNVHVSGMALWAEVTSSGVRNEGGGIVYNNAAPDTILSANTSANEQGVGWNTGTNHNNGVTLWTGTTTGSNQYLPSNNC
jgi:hypothetical protein